MSEVKAAWPFPEDKKGSYRVQLRRQDGSFGSYVLEADDHEQARSMVKLEEPDAVSVVALKQSGC
jgi:hypothetical protein